jgi:hypothetical protein
MSASGKERPLARCPFASLSRAQESGDDPVSGHPDHEEVVGLLLEDRLDRHAGVGAPEHGGEGTLDGSDPGRVVQ